MFTNWLTGTSSGSAAVSNNNSSNAENTSVTNAAAAAAAAAALASNASTGIMSTPPDVVLEVGPATSSGSVRFVAHSIVLGMHSGYLRSAIRLDENVIAATAAGGGSASGELVLYLGNVTAEQFAPLLTYMYTGYLDLNVENIFGVLLATHVLHMPRALEICRAFLARAQTDGYLGNNLPSIAAAAAATGSASNSGKVIRPIPSKATLPNFGFLPTAAPAPPPPPPAVIHAHQLSLPAAAAAVATNASNNAYKSLQQAYATPMIISESARERCEEISVELHAARDAGGGAGDDEDNDDEDEEVFIDSSSNSATDNEAETEIDCTISVTSGCSTAAARANLTVARSARPESATKCERFELLVAEKPTLLREETRATPTVVRSARNSTNATTNTKKRVGGSDRRKQQSTQRNKTGGPAGAAAVKAASGGVGGLQVAKAPIPASQLPDVADGGPKFIVDVASCDGPVRFRRILNTAYGHKPEAYASAAVLPERTQQSVSLSFHQQMAKTISQQRQLQHADESENSESSVGGGGGTSGAAGGSKSSKPHASNEIYVCVYCKHTFKSQYCYQKHAKRHLNPLSLNCTSTSGSGTSGGSAAETREKLESVGGGCGGRSSYRLPQASLPIVGGAGGGAGGKQQNNTELLLRREVRPLDMNVQYYPCKTCGSKFPSYYFVHKHRKMCHADEEAAAAATAATAAETSKTAAESECKEGGSVGTCGAATSAAKQLD